MFSSFVGGGKDADKCRQPAHVKDEKDDEFAPAPTTNINDSHSSNHNYGERAVGDCAYTEHPLLSEIPFAWNTT